MRFQREIGGILNWMLILLAAVGLVASIVIPGRALTREAQEMAQARQDMLSIVTAENRAYSENQQYFGTLDSLQTFIDWQTARYGGVIDSLSGFFETTEHPVEEVNLAADQAGGLREYLQYVEDLVARDRYVAIADSVFRYLRFQGDLQIGAPEFRRVFDEVSDALQSERLEPAEFEALAVKVDSLELVYRADPGQLEQYSAYREDLYLSRALLPARDRFQATLEHVDAYLEAGDRAPGSLRVASSQADSLRFCFLFGGDAEASESLEEISNFLAYRADLIEREDGYAALFGVVGDYMRDQARDPEIAREMSDFADSLKYCFLFDSPGLMGTPVTEAEGGERAEPISRTLDLSQISNFLYGLSSSWNVQLDSLTVVVPETRRAAHREARKELKRRIAEDQAVKMTEAIGHADKLDLMRGELSEKLGKLEEELVDQRSKLPKVREALESRLAGGTVSNVTLVELRDLFEANLLGNPARSAELKRQISTLEREQFPPSTFNKYSPAFPRVMYRLELDGDKVSVRCLRRDDYGEIIEGDATW